jgi:hypothetical protein
MADYTKQVLDLLSANGCYFIRRGKGSRLAPRKPAPAKLLPVKRILLC